MVRKTALFERHVALGARIVEFAGWMLPVQYPTGPKEEHLRVRSAAGLFDIDHMGQVDVRGSDALAWLQHMVTADVSRLEVGAAGYGLLCYGDGTIVDDVFVYRRADHYLVVVNAANNDKDTRWMDYHRAGFDVEVHNVSDEMYMLALQGPLSAAILQPLCDSGLSALAFHHAMDTSVDGVPTLVSRTGYTGEDGYELYFPASEATHLWDALLRIGTPEGLLPAGLAARDTLRLEAGMPLYGQEISASVHPYEARLGWAVALDKPSFLGREALLKARLEGSERVLVGLQMTEGGVARHGYAISAPGGAVVGAVTSGSYGPSLDAFVAMGYVPREMSAPGTAIEVDVRGRVKPAVVVRLPFYKPAYRR